VLPVARPFKRPRPFSFPRPAAPPPPVLSRASLFLLQSAALAACWLVSSRGLAGPSRLLPCLWFWICSFPLSLPPLCFFNQAQWWTTSPICSRFVSLLVRSICSFSHGCGHCPIPRLCSILVLPKHQPSTLICPSGMMTELIWGIAVVLGYESTVVEFVRLLVALWPWSLEYSPTFLSSPGSQGRVSPKPIFSWLKPKPKFQLISPNFSGIKRIENVHRYQPNVRHSWRFERETLLPY